MVLRRQWIAAVALGALTLPALAGCGPQASSPSSPAGSISAPAAQKVQIAETGSSLLYPLFNIWQPDYQKAHPNVQLTTASTGSGTGISQAIGGLVQIGASDAYMADAQVKQHPNMLNIPLVISAQQINYNLPGNNKVHLDISAPVLAGIYTGAIKYWDDPSIVAINPGTKLPHQAIVPIRRSDGSGDTFIFTQYLTAAAGAAWKAVGFGTTVTWPQVASEVAANGNQGVEQALKQTPGSIGYVGISWLDQANKDGLGYAALQNKNGKFVLPSADTIASAVNAMVAQTPADERVSLIDAPGDTAYPIINFEYAMVSKTQTSAAMATALQQLLTWALDGSGGNAPSYLNQVHFIALPAAVVKLSQAQIAEIAG